MGRCFTDAFVADQASQVRTRWANTSIAEHLREADAHPAASVHMLGLAIVLGHGHAAIYDYRLHTFLALDLAFCTFEYDVPLC